MTEGSWAMFRSAMLLLLGFTTPCWSGGELEAALGSAVSSKQERHRAIVEYCPDNTCERFVGFGDTSLANVQDFAFAYLFSLSNYGYLYQFQEGGSTTEVKSVLGRYHDWCPQANERAAAACIAGSLYRRNRIQLSFVRLDEGFATEEILKPGELKWRGREICGGLPCALRR